METIKDGYYQLTGIGETWLHDDYTGDDAHGIIIQLDGQSYVAYEDRDDGFRSYGRFYKTDEAPKVKIPYQSVCVSTVEEDTYDDNDWPIRYTILRIHNAGGGLILEVGTDHSDTYYPVAIFHYHPENLPINRSNNG